METVLYPTRKSLEIVARWVKTGLDATTLVATRCALEGIATELYIDTGHRRLSTHKAKPKRHRHKWVDHPASKATLVIERCSVIQCPGIRYFAPRED